MSFTPALIQIYIHCQLLSDQITSFHISFIAYLLAMNIFIYCFVYLYLIKERNKQYLSFIYKIYFN